MKNYKIKEVATFISLLNDTTVNDNEKVVKLFRTVLNKEPKNITEAIELWVKYDNDLQVVGVAPSLDKIPFIIDIKGQRFGLEPSLENMPTGAFLDLDNLLKEQLETVIHKVLAVLYRPLKVQIGNGYELEDYISESNEQKEKREQLFYDNFLYKDALSVAFFY